MDSARLAKAALAVSLLTGFCPSAFALNPALAISQYAHTAWTIRDGFLDSPIQTIAQTPDGYLWLGTEFGLFRFDGVQKVLWNPPPGEHLPSPNVTKLLAARDGRLWIGTKAGLASWKDNRFSRYPEIAEQVAALAEDGDGTLWAGTLVPRDGRLCGIRRGAVQCYGEDGSLGGGVLSLFEENGNLWAAAGSGLWRWKPGPPKHYATPGPASQTATDFSKADDGRLMAATPRGLQLVGERIESSPIAAGAYRLLRDRNGGLWIGTFASGLLHVYQGRTDQFSQVEGLSGDEIFALFEDREGVIWVATSGGIDRFRDFSVPSMSSKQGLAGDLVPALLAARDGSVWISGAAGLNRWKNGQITIFSSRDGLPYHSTESLLEDSSGRIWVSTPRGLARLEGGRFVTVRTGATSRTWQIAEAPAGSFWTAWEAGLIHLLGDEVVERIPWPALGHSDVATFLTGDPKRGGVWLGFRQGGLLFFKDGRVQESYTTSQGLGAGMVRGVFPRADGSVWAAAEGGFSRIKDGHVATLNSRNGLPCDSVRAAVEDAGHAVWLYLDCGLARISPNEFEAWAAHPDRPVSSTVFGASDGVIKQTSAGQNPKAARLKDGQLWFATLRGVSMVDPANLPSNKLPPPVHIEQIIADRKVVSDRRLPPLTRDLEIDYTALSLVAPEKNRFKYKLEGHDRDWQDAGNRRQVFYNDLPPRQYRFRVIASNNSGVWNETGDSLEFSIAPAYYQTNWFRASLVAAFFLALWALYRLRLHQLAREFNAQMEGRVDERLRVARDLHDTLLQSFQGLVPVFQTARNLLPGQSGRAAQVLDEGLHDAADAIVEGRNAIQNLRAIPSLDPDLGTLLNAAGEELAQSPEADGSAPAFRVMVEGPRQPLAPLIRDDIYRIGREVLRNAFRHAHAGRIEAEIRYDRDMFRLRIRDDGKGIDSSVLKEGARAGHFGLPGMHERAQKMGARLKIWSEPGAGTEAELTVPARIAYEKFSTSNGWWARLGRRLRPTAPNREAS